MSRYLPGDTVLVQDMWQGRLWTARPMTVVEDEDERVVLWMPKGTLWQGSTMPATRPRPEERLERVLSCLELCDWALQERELGLLLLWFIPVGAFYAITLSWSESGEFGGWYVNMQEPIRRTSMGFQTMDLMLDVVIRRDRTWLWKDEDEFEAANKRGILDEAKAAVLRTEAQGAIGLLEKDDAPFCEPWPSWRSEPSWALPVLPEGWERLG